MNKKCPFKDGGNCDIWIDHTVLQYELSGYEELLHRNWLEICNLYDRIEDLEDYIDSIGGIIPEEY